MLRSNMFVLDLTAEEMCEKAQTLESEIAGLNEKIGTLREVVDVLVDLREAGVLLHKKLTETGS